MQRNNPPLSSEKARAVSAREMAPRAPLPVQPIDPSTIRRQHMTRIGGCVATWRPACGDCLKARRMPLRMISFAHRILSPRKCVIIRNIILLIVGAAGCDLEKYGIMRKRHGCLARMKAGALAAPPCLRSSKPGHPPNWLLGGEIAPPRHYIVHGNARAARRAFSTPCASGSSRAAACHKITAIQPRGEGGRTASRDGKM